MIGIEATTTILLAAAILVVWRAFLWWRRGGDVVRETGIVALALWALVLIAVTFFPLSIVFYDWAGTSNFVPLASISQLLRETSSTTALTNIGGNLVLLAPFGFLMPLLFTRVRSLWALTWRAAAVSLAIELGQSATGARATDVDDVLLNTVGAMVGYAVYRGFRWAAERSTGGHRLLNRLESTTAREPLLLAWVPMLTTAVIVIPLILSAIFDATLGGRGIVSDAVSLSSGGEVVARADLQSHAFLIVRNDDDTTPTLALTTYERLPLGRFVRTAWGDPAAENPSAYSYSTTEFNTTREAGPTIVVWGSNQVGATTVEIASGAKVSSFDISGGRYFVAGDVFPTSDTTTRLDLAITFIDAAGNDITDQFAIY